MSASQQDMNRLTESLLAYLRGQLDDAKLEFRSRPEELIGGNQSRVCRFTLRGAGGALVDRPLVLRLHLRGSSETATWEGALQNVLLDAELPVARVHLVCTDESVLGAAFLIMDEMRGELLIDRPEILHRALGVAHAHLHDVDPSSVTAALSQAGVDPARYGFKSQFDWLENYAQELPWALEGVQWMIENRPSEPKSPSLCHRDFHALNVLVEDGSVSGILDWGGLLVADPAFDVANTVMLLTIPGKHLYPDPAIGAGEAAYLAAYRSRRPLDESNVPYYKAMRCLTVLMRGALGASVYQHPLVVADLLTCIREVSGVAVVGPQ